MLTGEVEAIRLHTGKAEITSDEVMWRWQIDGDEGFFADDWDDDPNLDSVANLSDWRRSSLRPRFPYE